MAGEGRVNMAAATPGVLILSGTPGAGKTTVSQLVAERLERSAVIRGDDVALMIVNGSVSPAGEPAAEAERQLLMRAQNISMLANNFSAAGFCPILDHVVPNRRVLRAMLRWLTPRPVLFVTLAPTIAVAQHRNRTRDPQEHVPTTTPI